MIQGHTPFCHMVIPMTLIPAALSRTIIFPGSMLEGFASIGTMLVLWLGVPSRWAGAGAVGVCFYGGLDEGFSKIGRKPILQRINRKWTYLPFAVLLMIALTSAATLTPTYCAWLCPFKAVTEFEAVTSATVLMQTVIFVSALRGPGDRPADPHRNDERNAACSVRWGVSVLHEQGSTSSTFASTRTSACSAADARTSVPTFSIDGESIKKGRMCMTSKCGRCVDECPKGAISYHIKGAPVGIRAQAARLLFVYPAYLLLAIMGSGMIIQATHRLLLLATTGSIIQINEAIDVPHQKYLAYGWAFLAGPLVLATFMGMNFFAGKLVAVTGLHVHPLYTGGEVAETIDHGRYRTSSTGPSSTGSIGQREYGILPYPMAAQGRQSARAIDEQIDFDADGSNDFAIRLDTVTCEASIEILDERVLAVDEVVGVPDGRIVRVGLRRTPR